MTIREIANQVCFNLSRSRTSLVSDDGQDMVIAALNHAKKVAERDFWYGNQMAEAWLTVDPTDGGDLGEAKLMSGATFSEVACRVKGVQTLYLGTDNTTLASFRPIYHDPKQLSMIKRREQCSWGQPYNNDFLIRYPGDYSPTSPYGPYATLFLGRKLFFNPAFSAERVVGMDVQLWMDDYEQDRVLVTSASTGSTSVTLSVAAPLNVVVGTTLLGQNVTVISVDRLTLTLGGNANAAKAFEYVSYTNRPHLAVGNANEDYSDWFTEAGSDYLVYAAMCALNYKTNTFVQREAGFSAPPTKERDSALLTLRSFDTFQWEGGRIPMRNR